MKRAYIYPNSAFDDPATPNQYLEEFMDGLSASFTFLNRDYPSTNGILDLKTYFRKIDVLFLHWIEDIPDKRGGLVQTIFFITMVFVLKILKVKLIWVMHNKASHYGSNKFLKSVLFRFIIRQSSFIITHSKEGLRVLDRYKIKAKNKARYFPHPLVQKSIPKPSKQTIDILIWGSIIPYKGTDIFLEFLHKNKLEKSYRIMIAGKVRPLEYEKVVEGYCNEFIQLDNRYVPDEEIEQYMADAKVVLFAYDGGSVLSSGALMDSLSYGVNILAPHVGAFKDAQEEGLINTYGSFEELVQLLEKVTQNSEDRRKLIRQFIGENDWRQFSSKVAGWILET